MNKYPIYVISKGRSKLACHTSHFLTKAGIEHKIVIEPQERDDYLQVFESNKLLILPFSNLGQGSIPARNWVWEHSKSLGFKWHWILDDNIRSIYTWKNGKRQRLVDCSIAFEKIEQFTDRFSNIGISGMNYSMFGIGAKATGKPFYLNHHVYSCLLIRNDLPFRWRGRYNEDTDLCLQVLTNNWCTINVNAYMIEKMPTMVCKGGNTAELYKGNGRLKMARTLELAWTHMPGLVKTVYKFKRPQHSVNWSIFKTPLKEISK